MDPSNTLKLVAQRVRYLRKKKGLSQEELGERAGFHFSYIGGVERAEKNISVTNLERIALALDTTIADLFIFTNNKRPSKSDEARIVHQISDLLAKLDKNELNRAFIILREVFSEK